MADAACALARNHLQDIEALEENREQQGEMNMYLFLVGRHMFCVCLSA